MNASTLREAVASGPAESNRTKPDFSENPQPLIGSLQLYFGKALAESRRPDKPDFWGSGLRVANGKPSQPSGSADKTPHRQTGVPICLRRSNGRPNT